MDLRQLEILRAVAERGSFTGAGRHLHLSQSAVSRQILLLEEELHEPLFLRIGRKSGLHQPAISCSGSLIASSMTWKRRARRSARARTR